MIDLHNHLLPGIDDGAPDLPSALALARLAQEEGITHLVCTPHIHPGRYDNSPDTIQPALNCFREGLAQAGIPLQVAAAAEVRFGIELMVGIEQRQIPFLGQWEEEPVLLLEFPHGDIPFGAERLVKWLRAQRVRPMIAHPERNKAIMRTPSKLKPFLQMGCLTQLTASSLIGGFGSRAREVAVDLLEQGMVTILATDAHNLEHRPPLLQDAVAAAAEILGEQVAVDLVTTRPWHIAQGHFQ